MPSKPFGSQRTAFMRVSFRINWDGATMLGRTSHRWERPSVIPKRRTDDTGIDRRGSRRAPILSQMAKYVVSLDAVFGALSDPTRRHVIGELGRGPASVGDLSRSSTMTLPSFMKHIRVLESSGLIRTTKAGRVRTCTLDRERLAVVDGWLAAQRASWERHTDRLEQFVTNPKEPS